jgi:DnaJ-class molecular chaperone
MDDCDMNLPLGKTAESCVHFNRCNKLFGCRAEYTTCDFSPSRYRETNPSNNSAKAEICPACKGFGDIAIEWAHEYTICSICNGTGKLSAVQ